jgi:hypothetical protein
MKCFGMMMDGRAQVTGICKRGHDATLLLVINSYSDVVDFTLPESRGATAGCASRIQMRRMRRKSQPSHSAISTGSRGDRYCCFYWSPTGSNCDEPE